MDRSTAALGLSVVALVPAVFSSSLPPVAAVHASTDQGGHLAHAETTAVGLACVLVLGTALVTRTPAVAGLGLAATALYAYAYERARRAGQ